ncbi:MAG: hypothetical protein ACJ72Z_10875 [Pyrinomonadaceae bacterium]
MKLGKFTHKLLISAAGAIVLFGSATFVLAQRGEYNEWQEAVRNEQKQRMIYQRNPSRSNYNEWRDAQRDAQEEYAKYQRALREEGGNRYNNRYNDRYYNGRNVVVNASPRSGMYRIYTNGQYYNVDNRGYSLLREAVNRGYQQGFQAGIRDRRYGNYNYYNNSMYMSGSYGYNSYVERNQYQYYFQQGFQRGYEDGFYSRTRYGTRVGSTYNILGSVLNTILNVAAAASNDNDWDNR